MTRTGCSCIYKKPKTKHGCPIDVEYYCELSGETVKPLFCHKKCADFKTVADLHRRPARKTEVELL